MNTTPPVERPRGAGGHPRINERGTKPVMFYITEDELSWLNRMAGLRTFRTGGRGNASTEIRALIKQAMERDTPHGSVPQGEGN